MTTNTRRIDGSLGPTTASFMPDLVQGSAEDIDAARREAARLAEIARREIQAPMRERAGLHGVTTTDSLGKGGVRCAVCREPVNDVLVPADDQRMVCRTCFAEIRAEGFDVVQPVVDAECVACGGTGRVSEEADEAE